MQEQLRSIEIEKISNEDPYYDDLVCPRCGEYFLHHRNISVYSRNQDDEVVLKTLVVEGVAAVVLSDGVDNPSLRRDGLAIDFHCEHCCDNADEIVAQLCIAQHKGHTGVFWRMPC